MKRTGCRHSVQALTASLDKSTDFEQIPILQRWQAHGPPIIAYLDTRHQFIYRTNYIKEETSCRIYLRSLSQNAM